LCVLSSVQKIKFSKEMKVSGADFENYMFDTISKRFPAYEGWNIEPQYTLGSGRRVDYLVWRDKCCIVIDCKDRATLSYADIDQILDYVEECNALKCIIYVANDTYVSDTVKQCAQDSDVEIQRTQWRI
jgi:hypothetical protein